VERFSLTTVDGLAAPPRYNLAPGSDTLVQTSEGVRPMRWGMLAPRHGHYGKRGPPIERVSLEVFAAIPAARVAFEQRRCLVLADGFFAWRGAPNRQRAQPTWIHPEPVRRIAFAGVWSVHRDDGRDSFAVVTVPSAAPADAITPTMPLVVDERWLGRLADARALVASQPLVGWRADAISDWVDDPSHDDARVTELLRNRAQGELF